MRKRVSQVQYPIDSDDTSVLLMGDAGPTNATPAARGTRLIRWVMRVAATLDGHPANTRSASRHG